MHGGDRPKDADGWMRRVETSLDQLDTRARATGRTVVAKNIVTTTDSNGRASFLFGRTFTDPPVVTLTGGSGEHVAIYLNTITTTGFTVQFTSATGTPAASQAVRLLWTATPATV